MFTSLIDNDLKEPGAKVEFSFCIDFAKLHYSPA